MRIVHHTWSFDFGGIERMVFDLAAQQQRNGHTVTVHTGRDGGRQLKLLAEAGITHRTSGLKSGASASPGKLLQLRSFFRQFDIIHLHSFTPLVALAACMSGKKIVFTEHGNFAFGRVRRASDRMNSALLRYFLNHCVSYASFNSVFTQEEARKRYSMKKVKQQVIHNGIPNPGISPAPLPAEWQERLRNRFVVGTSSRLAGFKKVDRLITAYSIFAKDKPDTCLLLVGDGPCRKDLEAQAERLGIAGGTVFTGYAERVRDFQDAMHVCVFPSQGEPFGIAALETLSLGKPTLVMADGGGILEIIRPLEPEDIAEDTDQLAARLSHYYSIRDIDIARQHRRDHAKKFDIATMEQSFQALYNRLLN